MFVAFTMTETICVSISKATVSHFLKGV